MNLSNSLVTLLLTNRLVAVPARPLTASQFWELHALVPDLGTLAGASVEDLTSGMGISPDLADRIPVLLDAVLAFSFERERMEESGIRVLSFLDEGFPARLRAVLGRHSPASLLMAGNPDLLESRMRGIVGSRNANPEASELAETAARAAVKRGEVVVSGLARGIDQVAMGAALAEEVGVVGVPSEGLRKSARAKGTRALVHDGRLCMVSPYGPDSPFSVGNAMGRNKIVYGLSTSTLVVCSDKGKGGTWDGAKEALKNRFSQVDVWMGAGAGPGNEGIAQLGARPVGETADLWTVDFEPGTQDPGPQPGLFD
jgi:predicted Rossmann fold nucleotide-binding protein DprA/Smf involved in DNA uptake